MKKQYIAPATQQMSVKAVFLDATKANTVNTNGGSSIPEGGSESPSGGRAKAADFDEWDEWE